MSAKAGKRRNRPDRTDFIIHKLLLLGGMLLLMMLLLKICNERVKKDLDPKNDIQVSIAQPSKTFHLESSKTIDLTNSKHRVLVTSKL